MRSLTSLVDALLRNMHELTPREGLLNISPARCGGPAVSGRDPKIIRGAEP